HANLSSPSGELVELGGTYFHWLHAAHLVGDHRYGLVDDIIDGGEVSECELVPHDGGPAVNDAVRSLPPNAEGIQGVARGYWAGDEHTRGAWGVAGTVNETADAAGAARHRGTGDGTQSARTIAGHHHVGHRRSTDRPAYRLVRRAGPPDRARRGP